MLEEPLGQQPGLISEILRDPKAQREIPVQLALKGLRGIPAPQGKKEPLAQPVLREQKGIPEIQVKEEAIGIRGLG